MSETRYPFKRSAAQDRKKDNARQNNCPCSLKKNDPPATNIQERQSKTNTWPFPLKHNDKYR